MSDLINLSQVGNILSNIGNKLTSNQNLLKCIHYNTPNALSQEDIDIMDIINLIGKGTEPKVYQRIFKTPFNNLILDDVRSELRFFIPKIKPENIYLSNLSIRFQIINHNTIMDLDDNKMRSLVMALEIIKELNGFDCGGIGNLYLTTSIDIVSWSDSFTGYVFSMNTKTV